MTHSSLYPALSASLEKRMHGQKSFRFIILFALIAFIIGCGSVSDSSNTGPGSNPSPTPSPPPGSSPTPTPTPVSGEVRLRARGEAVISGIEAELRGTFERRPDRTRLDGELEDINLPLGSAISFCLVQGGSTIPLAVGIVQLEAQRRVAEFHIRTDDGQTPPNVQAGNVLQARDGANSNLPDCLRRLLVAGTFVPDN